MLVKRVESEEKTASGIYIPDSAKEKPAEGIVIAVGPGKLDDNGSHIEVAVSVNDRVLFAKYAGSEIKVGGEEHMILREKDILGVVEA